MDTPTFMRRFETLAPENVSVAGTSLLPNAATLARASASSCRDNGTMKDSSRGPPTAGAQACVDCDSGGTSAQYDFPWDERIGLPFGPRGRPQRGERQAV